MDMRVIVWLFRAALAGLISWGFPRLLVAIGVPLDRWISAMAENILNIPLSLADAIWVATSITLLVLAVVEAKWAFGKRTVEKLSGKKPAIAEVGSVDVDISVLRSSAPEELSPPTIEGSKGNSDDKRIYLDEAAKTLYGQLSDKVKADIVKAAKNRFSISSHCGAIILNAAQDGLVSLYGRREVGLVHEKISREDLRGVWSLDDPNELIAPGSQETAWEDVQIVEADVEKVARSVESGDTGHGADWYELWGAINWFDEHASAKLKASWERFSKDKEVSLDRAVAQSILNAATYHGGRLYAINEDGRPKQINSSDPITILACIDTIEKRQSGYFIRDTDLQGFLDTFEKEAQ